jgi:phosphoglycerate dehydrogenase-like enzyme
MAKSKPTIIIEDDVWLRLIGVVLDPTTSRERWTAFADFMSPDLPDFQGWCVKVQQTAGALYPSDIKLVKSQAELRENIGPADAIIVESMPVGAEELALAPNLKAVHKYGMLLRGIDVAACEVCKVEVLSVRRRANIACAEHAFALMLSLARKLNALSNLISVDQLPKDKLPYRPFDRRHTPGANWGRFSGTRTLYGDTMGIIGLGEIGREIASRATAFGMKALYYQRTQLRQDDEKKLGVTYCSLESLLANSDWVVPQLPYDDTTARFIGRERLAQMKRGACIINVSRPELLDCPVLLDALRTGHLGGLGMDGSYEEPGRADDELLSFGNVVLTPHMGASPRTNGLQDIEDMIRALAQALAK